MPSLDVIKCVRVLARACVCRREHARGRAFIREPGRGDEEKGERVLEFGEGIYARTGVFIYQLYVFIYAACIRTVRVRCNDVRLFLRRAIF